jgi:DUF4097 and DUF4098 domain-containing protein YvlB
MSQTFAVEGPLEVSAKLGAGRVEVQPAEPGTAGAWVDPIDPAHEPSVRAAAQAEIRLAGGHLRVDVPEQNRLFRRAQVLVRLALPTGSDLSVKAGAADVTVAGGLRALAVKNGAGAVTVDSAESVAVKSGQTDVRVERAGAVAVTTGQGSLRAGRVGEATFKTGLGEVELGRTDGQVSVKGGAVQLRIEAAGAGAVLFDTGAGSATVGVVPGTTVAVDLMSAAGDVRCDVPLDGTGGGGDGEPTLRLRLRTGAGDLRVFPTSAAVSA